MIASAPKSAARSCVLDVEDALQDELAAPGIADLATFSQSSFGSNCSFVQLISERRSPTPLAWPTMLRNVRRWVPSIPSPQCGLVARFSRFGTVRLRRGGQVVLQVLVPLAQDLEVQRQHQRRAFRRAAPVRSCRRRNPRRASRKAGTRRASVVCSATSSIEQIDMVDSVKGTPNFSAARAALISPSACCIPVMPTGASATGIDTGWPDHRAGGRPPGHVHRDLLAEAQLRRSRSRSRGRSARCSCRFRNSRRTSSAARRR